VADDLRIGRVTIPADELQWRYDTPGGPGGQHANRAATRVELTWDLATSNALTEADHARLLEKLGPTITVTASDTRSQSRNKDLAQERLRTQIGEALKPQRPRRKTKPTKASKQRRVEQKRHRAATKRNRGRVRPED
jgi:ribosome-associated protein